MACLPHHLGRGAPLSSNHNRHRPTTGADGHASDPLGHDHDPQRLDTPLPTAEFGSTDSGHRPGRLLMLQILHRDIGPSSAEHIEHIATIEPW